MTALLLNVAHAIGGFEGNAQTLRLLTRLEPKVVALDGRPAGLNLTRASLDAAAKYPWSAANAPVIHGERTSKFGAYEDDLPIFDWIREDAPERRSCASTSPSARVRLPTTIRSGQPSSSASVSFSPGPASRSSNSGSSPASLSSS